VSENSSATVADSAAAFVLAERRHLASTGYLGAPPCGPRGMRAFRAQREAVASGAEMLVGAKEVFAGAGGHQRFRIGTVQ
jgi:hypothetical protein